MNDWTTNPSGWISNPLSPSQLLNPLNPLSPVNIYDSTTTHEAAPAPREPLTTPQGEVAVGIFVVLVLVALATVGVVAFLTRAR